MPTKRDYYEVLEVGRSASPEELRRAYRRLAKQYHPDVNKDDSSEERFKEINEAYAVLSDEERRASYDRFGHAGVQGLPTDFGFGFADIFYDLTLEFLEAVAGVEKPIEFSRQEFCSACHGSGA